MKLVLLSLHVEKSSTAFPLAAAILKTELCRAEACGGLEISSLELYLPVIPADAAKLILSGNPDIAGFTVCTWNAAEIVEIASELKRNNPEIILIAGGPQASVDPERLAATGAFSFIVRGEGETVLPGLIGGIKNGDIPVSRIIEAHPADFSGSPSPYKAVLKNGNYSGVLWELSRGCPYACSFCYESRGSRSVRTIPENRMASELRYFRKKGINKIWVLDPTFNHSHAHAEAVLKIIAENHPEAEYTFEIRAELMTEEICRSMSCINASLQVGLQSANPDALTHLNRNLNRKKFTAGCRRMAEYGLSFGIDLIYGLPGDNYPGFRNSLDFAVSLSPNNIDIFPLSVLPGTPLADQAGELGITHSGFPHYRVESAASFSSAEIKKAAELTSACDGLYNREQSFSWLNRAAEALELTPSGLFELWNASRHQDAADFINEELEKQNLAELVPVIQSFIMWSRTAEKALNNPGKAYRVNLWRSPEILDELVETPVRTFLQRYPGGKSKSYNIFFDGEELYID